MRAWTGKRFFMWWLGRSAAEKPAAEEVEMFSELQRIWKESA